MKLETIRKYSRRAGLEALAISEAAYLTMRDPGVNARHKALLLGSLAYLLMPLDSIPDFLPGGYADDIGLLLATLGAVGPVGQKHLQKCRLKYGLRKESETMTKEDH
jgi:uncharacterized membrane protein YkvA (DUF1232 family)